METDSWFGLDLRHLVALKTIADEGSFGRAAERLGYTQSAISQQIATLERIVGLRLIERPGGPRPVSLTEAGRILQRHADAIQARLLAAKADMRALEAGQRAGGDSRGKTSAVLLVASPRPMLWHDLRVDMHPSPVEELRRVFDAAKIMQEGKKPAGGNERREATASPHRRR